MRDVSYRKILSVFLISILVGGCSGNERQMDKALKAAVSVFREEAQQPNTEVGSILVYLPETFKVEEEQENNLILKRGNQTYILFVNPQEKIKSSLLFLTAEKQSNQNLLLKSFQTDDKFGYISIKDLTEETYELAVGSGGVKLTTETDKEHLEKEADEMMEIVSSVPQK